MLNKLKNIKKYPANKLFSKLFLFLTIFISSFLLSSCASVDKENSVSCAVVNNEFSYVYNEYKDTTYVEFTMSISNDSIYDLNEEYFKFRLFEKDLDVPIEETFTYTMKIAANSNTDANCRFEYEGEIIDVSFISAEFLFSDIWNTYFGYFLAVIIIVPTFFVIYTIVVFVKDLDLDDLTDFLFDSDHYWWIPTVIISLIAVLPYIIISSVYQSWNWVPIVIILGGIISAILLTLFSHFIKFIYEVITDALPDFSFDCGRNNKTATEEEILNNIKKSIQQNEDLNIYTKDELLLYCFVNDINVSNKSIKKANLIDLIVSKKKSKKTITRKTFSKLTFKDIAGLDEAKKAFNEKIVLPMKHPELYEKYNKKVGGGILLYGLPGTGKTMFAEACANELDALFIPQKCSDIKSKWYGESEQNIKKIFDKARKADRAIIFFDEFEAIGAKRNDYSNDGNNDLVPEILAEMQGVKTSNSEAAIMVIAATNKPWSIDSAFLRPGRFDEKIYIPLPDYDARKVMFKIKLKKIPVHNIDYDYLAKITEGFNGADINEFVEKLKQLAINKTIATNEEHTINMDDVKEIQQNIKSSVSKEDIDAILEFQENNL